MLNRQSSYFGLFLDSKGSNFLRIDLCSIQLIWSGVCSVKRPPVLHLSVIYIGFFTEISQFT